MFQSALVRRHNTGSDAVDAGVLAETLLFYNSVHVVADGALLGSLIKSVGADNLIQLLDEKLLTMSYSTGLSSVKTEKVNDIKSHFFTSITVIKDEKGKKIGKADNISRVVRVVLGDTREARLITKKLLDRLTFREVGIGNSKSSAEIVADELLDSGRFKSLAQIYFDKMAPGVSLPAAWEVRCIPRENPIGEFFIMTDLNFSEINRQYHTNGDPEGENLDEAMMLARILDARIDADLAADYMAELVTTNMTSDMIRVRLSKLLQRRDQSKRDIDAFQEVHLDSARAIREAINSGERSFQEFLPTLRKAHRFKQWLAEGNPDAKLLKEYYESALEDTWANKLPIKLIRYLIAGVAGLASPITGLAASAADEFLVDRILKGWKPNQFVDGRLKPFVGTT